MTRGKIVSVYSPKGGTGCTTIAVNLALALHNDDTRVVIVDSNLQYGDVACSSMSRGRIPSLIWPRSLMNLTLTLLMASCSSMRRQASVSLASPSRPELADKITADQFLKILEFLRRMYAYVVVDTPSFLGDVTVAAIDVSDVIVLVTTQDIPAIKNARLFLDLLQNLRIDRGRIAFVMNRFDKRIAITAERVRRKS